MTKRTIIAASALSILLAVVSDGRAAEKPLRQTLESTWSAYLTASKTGKESELEKTMSSFRLGMMKNNLASAKRSLTPDIIKSISEHMPSITTARFVSLIEKGPTAALVYVQDSEEKDATNKPRIEFIFIKFVKEESEWKVDAGMNIGSPKFDDNGKESQFDPSDLPPTYEIDGEVRNAPAPISAPEVSGLLDVFSYGYKTEVIVNGVKQGTPVEASRSGLLKEGLRKGNNSIMIVVVQTEKDTAFHPRVTVRRVLADRKTEEVFKFEPTENIEGQHTLSFTINE